MIRKRIWCWTAAIVLTLGAQARATHVFDRNGDGKVIVACLGDSNTGPFYTHTRSWCDFLQDQVGSLGWTTVNKGVSSGRVTRELAPYDAKPQWESTVAAPDKPDIAILAFGTNDLGAQGSTKEQTVAAYEQLKTFIESDTRAPNCKVVIALAPPQCETDGDGNPRMIGGVPVNQAYAALNDLTLTTFPGADDTIDFYAIMVIGGWCGGNDYTDCIHMNDGGEQKRGNEAFRRLTHAP